MANFFKKYAPMLAGGAVGALTSGMPNASRYGAALSTGAGALASAATKGKVGQGALQGFLGGGLGSTATQGIKGAMGAGSGSVMDSFMSGSGSGWRGYMGSIPGMGGFGTSNPTGALAKFATTSAVPATAAGGFSRAGMASNAWQPATSTSNVRGQVLAGVYGKNAPLIPDVGTKFSLPQTSPVGAFNVSKVVNPGITTNKLIGGGTQNVFQKAMPGLLTSMAGNVFAPQVAAPDFSGITSRLDKYATEGANPEARALGMGQLRTILNAPDGAVPSTAFTEGDIYSDRQLQEDLANLENQFKAAMPGADVANNSEYINAREKILRNRTEQRTAARDAMQYQYSQAQQQQKLAAMQSALGLDQTQMQYLMNIAGLEVDQIMAQTGLEYGEAAQLKELFSTAGSAMMESSLGLTRLPGTV